MMVEEEVDTGVEEEVAEVDMVVAVGPMVTVMEEAVDIVVEVVDMEVAVDTEGVEEMEVVAVVVEVVATKHLMITRCLLFTSKSTECCIVN